MGARPPAPPAPAAPGPGELEQLQERIEAFRSQLREALARRAELQTSLANQRAAPPTTVDGPAPQPARHTDTSDKRVAP
ncbi:hypothetical protein AAFF_G00298100 [Aldrovandia affinis]|uniref:Uncharacterized protein n=1 Tax=Aldrovandia affinis TaxID=143900 RepID=A0AAD7W187_9TELE|nr:hypothetical protein AAFF_G00298100 [Aldrovandia affinis]